MGGSTLPRKLPSTRSAPSFAVVEPVSTSNGPIQVFAPVRTTVPGPLLVIGMKPAMSLTMVNVAPAAA